MNPGRRETIQSFPRGDTGGTWKRLKHVSYAYVQHF